MFWRFGFHNPSAIDTLLDRDDIELEDILEEEDLLQEAKSHNQKLVDYLCKQENLTKLVHYITAPDLDENRRFKYPFLACEILACEIPQMVDAIVLEHKELLESFWAYLDRPAPPRRRVADAESSKAIVNQDGDEEDNVGLDPLQAQYFCKTISVFLTKRTSEILEFIKSRPSNLSKILAHLQSSAIMDLLLTLVRVEELSEGKGIVQWLSDNGLLENLIERLDPYLDSEEHSVAQQCISEIIRMSQTSLLESPSIGLNDLIIGLKSEPVIRKLAGFMLDAKAPNSTSTLINGVTIIIDLIRHNNSDMDNDPMMNGAYGYPANSMVRQTSVSLADMLRVLSDHVGDFNNLLLHPRSVSTPMKTSIGEQVPLGFERLKICELFAELLHCSNMSNLNNGFDADDKESDGQANPNGQQTNDAPPEPERLPEKDIKASDEAESGPKSDDSEHLESQQPSETGTGFNVSDGPTIESDGQTISIGDYLKTQFVEHKVMPTCIDLFFTFPWNNFLHYVIYDMLHQVFNGRMDKGYNRHLAISVFKDGKLTDRMVQAQKANDEECARPKGMRLGYMGHLTFIADEIIKLFEGYPESVVSVIRSDVDIDIWNEYCNAELKETKERDRLPLAGPRPNEGFDGVATDEEEEEGHLEGATGQYSRYLATRGAEGEMEEDEDEETENWITGRDDYDREYSYDGTFGLSNNEDAQRRAGGHDEMDDDEEYGSDDDEESGRMPVDWSRGFTPFPRTSTLERTESHIVGQGEAGEENKPTDQEEEEEDPFGDFTSSDEQPGEEWAKDFTTQFQNMKVSSPAGDAANKQQQQQSGSSTGAPENDNPETTPNRTPPQQQQTLSEEEYVRAVKTKEEEDGKLGKEYRSEEEQQGEI